MRALKPDEPSSTLENRGSVRRDDIRNTPNGQKHYDNLNNMDLPSQIHSASRTIHHTLHHAVVGRLPLALPPGTTSPHLYTLGISRFAQVYSTFENAWREYLESPTNDTKNASRYRTLLAKAYVPAITRSQRLSSDLSNLKKEWGDIVPQGNDAAVKDAVTHILETVESKPYVLLAYSWIMYMALFNGGRWIREQLLSAGPQFWRKDFFLSLENPEAASSLLGPTYLSFWYFDGDEDGEDIKQAYRAGFVEASRGLTEAECEDVVCEAKALFQHCLNIVTEIDVVVALQRKKDVHKYAIGAQSINLLLGIFISGILLAMATSYYQR